MDPGTKLLTLYGEREKGAQVGAGALRHVERHFGIFVRHVQARSCVCRFWVAFSAAELRYSNTQHCPSVAAAAICPAAIESGQRAAQHEQTHRTAYATTSCLACLSTLS